MSSSNGIKHTSKQVQPRKFLGKLDRSQFFKRKQKHRRFKANSKQAARGSSLGKSDGSQFVKHEQEHQTFKDKRGWGHVIKGGGVIDVADISEDDDVQVETSLGAEAASTVVDDKAKTELQKTAVVQQRKINDVISGDGDGVKQAYDVDHQLSAERVTKDMSAWSGLLVPKPVLHALSEQGFTSPTPIQVMCLPAAIKDNKDIIGAAETGSGKTLAFGIPLIHKILKLKRRAAKQERADGETSTERNPAKQLYALVLTPTRELAIQIKRHLDAASKFTTIKITVVVGGMAAEKQQRLLRLHPEIVVATPGRLWELIEQGDPHLSTIPDAPCLVVDEADRMVERGHFEELTKILEHINANRQNDSNHVIRRQTFVFSATLTLIHSGPRRPVPKKSNKRQRNKIESLVRIIGMRDDPKIADLSPKVGTADQLIETRIQCDMEDKDLYLYYLLHEYPGRTLVFTNSKDCVRRLVSVFTLLDRNPLPLHADMHQRQRLKNLERFTATETCLLLATDVAARGLDIPNVQHVIHYQVPRTAENYVHRSGRTARACKEGLSVMLVCAKELRQYRNILQTLNRAYDIPGFPLEESIVLGLKPTVSLAQHIDREQHKSLRKKQRKNWFQHMADQMDIELDSDDDCLDAEPVEQSHKAQQNLKGLKTQLAQALTRNVTPSVFSGRYPTQSGSLVTPFRKDLNRDAVKEIKVLQKATKRRPEQSDNTDLSKMNTSNKKQKVKSKEKVKTDAFQKSYKSKKRHKMKVKPTKFKKPGR